jgi:hypothetical protein
VPSLFLWALLVLAGLVDVAVGAGRAATRGTRPWLPLAVSWLGVTLTQCVANPAASIRPAAALALLAPLGVAALTAEAEVRRGCSLWWAGGLAVILGAAVAAATPFLIAALSMILICPATGGCGF